jgi:serine/threonine protein kinase/tetratricopeptide (TPR) repeat protein
VAVDAARAKALFLNASELADPAERTAYLERECGGDAELRQRVEALLAADDGGGRSLEGHATETSEPTSPETQEATAAVDAETRPPSELATAEDRSDGADFTIASAPRVDRPDGSGAGQVIAGRYTLREVLGEGGMGTVYRADQTAPVKRQVALKLIKVGMDSRAVLARFDAERQALALMDHPNIARVYDGGYTGVRSQESGVSKPRTGQGSLTPDPCLLTPDLGQPFFVMELVSGVPITDYCDRKRLPVRARLELFVSVCQAVQHAHQKGIIHRDLKPSNVLVTEVDGRPTPKVIDFGVAKATEFSLTDQSLADTGAIVGTPTYMSPEQADPSSMDIDTRTDVYALGVILYELLAGSPPIDAKQFKRGAILEMLRMVREVDPPKPSTKVSTSDALPSISANRDVEPAHLKRALQGDLDWIVMRALEKDRTRRYETANGFAADILRHLAHEPVVAAPPSRSYRLRKFVRKHRGAVIAASLVLLAFLGGLAAVAAVQTVANARLAESLKRETNANAALNQANGQLTRSRAAVQARYELATDAIKTFHTGVSEDFLLKEEKFKELRNRLLNSASDFYGKLGALLGKETDLPSRLALAQANFELSELTDKVGRKEDALKAHRAALASREALAAEPGAGAAATVDVGRSLTAVAALLEAMGKTEEALATYRRSESLLAGPAGTDPAARAALADCRARLGFLLSKTGQTAEALTAVQQALADQEALAAVAGAPAEARYDLASTVMRIALLLGGTGRRTEAEAEIRRALEISAKLAADHPAVAKYRLRLAAGHINIGPGLTAAGKPSEAEAAYRRGLEILQKLADDNPAVTEFRRGLALSHYNLGMLMAFPRGSFPSWNMLKAWGKPTEAEAELRRAVEIWEQLVADNRAVTEYRTWLAMSHSSLSGLLNQTGRPTEAEAELRRALEIRQKLVDDSPKVLLDRGFVGISYMELADLALARGRLAEARDGYDRGIAVQERLARDDSKTEGYRSDLARILRSRGLARAGLGDVSDAAADVRRALGLYDGLPKRSDDEWFQTACARATLAGLAGRDGAGVSAAEGKAEADRAMALLRKAVDMGYRDHVAVRTDSALEPLRQREDFKKLLQEMEQKSAARPW